MKKILLSKIPAYIFVLISAIYAFPFFYMLQAQQSLKTKMRECNQHLATTASGNCSMFLIRDNSFQFTKPLLMSDLDCESGSLEKLKLELISTLDQEKKIGNINSASIYLRKLDVGNWIVINGQEKFSPGSMMKVPTLITLVKQDELTPGFLDKKVLFSKKHEQLQHQTVTGPQLELNKYYTNRELMKYMIAYSNNDATALLNAQVDIPLFQKLFSILQMVPFDTKQADYPLTSTDFAKFFRILYNGSYLSKKNSEYALELLSQSTFTSGIMNGLDGHTISSHKFGERFENAEHQVHEFGIVYKDNSPYLIGVMAKGNEHDKIYNTLANVSKQVFENMQ